MVSTPSSAESHADEQRTAPGVSRWTVALCALFGLLAGLLFFGLRSPVYEAEALVAVSNPVGALSDEVAMMNSPRVVDAATSILGFAPDFAVTANDVAGLLTVRAQADDAQRAAETANTVATVYTQAQLGAAANVAQPATAPTSRSGLGPLEFAAIGTALGALAGMVLSPMQRLASERSTSTAQYTASEPLAAPRGVTVPQSPLAAGPAPPPANEAGLLAPSMVADAASPTVSATHPAPASPHALAQGDSDPHETDAPIESAQPDPIARSDVTTDNVPATDITTNTDPEPVSGATENSTETRRMNNTPSFFTDAATSAPKNELDELDRRAIRSQHEAARYELVLQHEQAMARLVAAHERDTKELRSEVAQLTKRVRVQDARLRNRSGSHQARAGDLEAQVVALESELSELRQLLESERIAHAKQLNEERSAADRALDSARLQYREELAKHTHNQRQALGTYRSDLDAELSESRERHASALEKQHAEYEHQLESQRAKLDAMLAAAQQRYEREIENLRAHHRREFERQADQYKDTIGSLRAASSQHDNQVRELEQQVRSLQTEVSTNHKQAQHLATEHAAAQQRAAEELAQLQEELDGERQRNAALRADVLRRGAEAHQEIDRAVEERTAQLAELEASVTRQREYADTRVREISAAAEEQARESATREAGLNATISRLKREVAELKDGRPST